MCVLKYVIVYVPVLKYVIVYMSVLKYIIVYMYVLKYIIVYMSVLKYIIAYMSVLKYIIVYMSVLKYIIVYMSVLKYIIVYMSVLKLSLLADFQQKVGEISYLLSFKLVYRQNVVMVTLITGIMFLLFTCMHFSVRGILRKWSATAESLRHAALQTPLPQHDYKNH
jgi:hypothetical protein